MTIPPSKFAAARLAAAEVFIESGLGGTNWDAEKLRRVASEMDFRVRYPAGGGSVDVHVDHGRNEIRVRVEPRNLDSMSTAEALHASDIIRSVAGLARKVEAAVREVLAS